VTVGGRVRLALLLGLLPLGCSHSGADLATLSSNSDQVIFEAGQKDAQRKNWEGARQHFKRIIDAFPQSQYGAAARLGLADSHFQEGGTASYIIAISEYRDFLTLFPSHPKSDYAQYQVGEAYYRQRNGPDRDQTSTDKALAEYQRLLDVYPSSGYVEAARKRIRELRQILARADYLAGFFYQKTRKAYRAAVARYEIILADYPDYEQLDEVLYRISQCLAITGRKAEALPFLGRLLEEYPKSSFADDARNLMRDINKAGTRSPAPSPVPSKPRPTPQALKPLKSPTG
jgi:outer membrane protein assembly factor BamD